MAAPRLESLPAHIRRRASTAGEARALAPEQPLRADLAVRAMRSEPGSIRLPHLQDRAASACGKATIAFGTSLARCERPLLAPTPLPPKLLESPPPTPESARHCRAGHRRNSTSRPAAAAGSCRQRRHGGSESRPELQQRNVELIRLIYHEARKCHAARPLAEAARTPAEILAETCKDVLAAARKCCAVVRGIEVMQQAAERRRQLRADIRGRLPRMMRKVEAVKGFENLLHHVQETRDQNCKWAELLVEVRSEAAGAEQPTRQGSRPVSAVQRGRQRPASPLA